MHDECFSEAPLKPRCLQFSEALSSHCIDERKPSPEAPTRLVHADLYRLSGTGDLAEIGWEDATAGRCWVFVEWPSRAADALPADRLDITISIDSETARTFQFTPRGAFALASL